MKLLNGVHPDTPYTNKASDAKTTKHVQQSARAQQQQQTHEPHRTAPQRTSSPRSGAILQEQARPPLSRESFNATAIFQARNGFTKRPVFRQHRRYLSEQTDSYKIAATEAAATLSLFIPPSLSLSLSLYFRPSLSLPPPHPRLSLSLPKRRAPLKREINLHGFPGLHHLPSRNKKPFSRTENTACRNPTPTAAAAYQVLCRCHKTSLPRVIKTRDGYRSVSTRTPPATGFISTARDPTSVSQNPAIRLPPRNNTTTG